MGYWDDNDGEADEVLFGFDSEQTFEVAAPAAATFRTTYEEPTFGVPTPPPSPNLVMGHWDDDADNPFDAEPKPGVQPFDAVTCGAAPQDSEPFDAKPGSLQGELLEKIIEIKPPSGEPHSDTEHPNAESPDVGVDSPDANANLEAKPPDPEAYPPDPDAKPPDPDAKPPDPDMPPDLVSDSTSGGPDRQPPDPDPSVCVAWDPEPDPQPPDPDPYPPFVAEEITLFPEPEPPDAGTPAQEFDSIPPDPDPEPPDTKVPRFTKRHPHEPDHPDLRASPWSFETNTRSPDPEPRSCPARSFG